MMRQHLSEDRLLEVCLDREPLASERRHLALCPSCEERRARVALLVGEVSDVAAAEADVAFGPERLARQRARILQRLEHEGRPGRLISFPASPVPAPSLRTRPRTRWVGVAAAAGLVIGLLAGQVTQQFRGVMAPPSQAGLDRAPGTLQAVSMTLSDEEFLGRLELAAEDTSGAALQPLDDMTPLVWEVAAQ